MPKFEVDVRTLSTVTYEVTAKNAEEARARWAALGIEISDFVEQEDVIDVRRWDERFGDEEDVNYLDD